MKMRLKILFITAIATTISCVPQIVPISSTLEDKLNNYQKVIEIAGKSKNQLFVSVNEWFVSEFAKSDNAIEFKDKKAGKISGKYVWQSTIKGQNYSNRGIKFNAFIQSTVLVDIKDNKLRIRIKNPLYRRVNSGEQPYKEIRRQETAKKILAEWKKIAKDLENHLKNEADDNW